MASQDTLSKRLDDIDADLFLTNVSTISKLLQRQALKFASPPTKESPALPHSDSKSTALDKLSPENKMVLAHERWLYDRSQLLDSLLSSVDQDGLRSRLRALVERVSREKTLFSELKLREWERQRRVALEHNTRDPGVYMNSPFLGLEPATVLSYITTMSLHFLSNLSLKHSDLVLFALNLQYAIGHNSLLSGGSAGMHPPSISPPSLGYALGGSTPFLSPSGPRSARTIIRQLNLSPKQHSYTCCPECCCLYELNDQCPSSCTHRPFPGSQECRAKLLISGSNRPTREYIMQDFEDWLARLYAHPGMEDLLDRASSYSATGEMRDVWDGLALRMFLGPNGKLFMDCPEGESRLIFSINMDGFNPLTNRQAGKKISCGAIYMSCLNLPPHLRNRPENIFLVGIIPGPREPSLTQINHFLKPLVDVLLRLWHVGLFLEHTRKYPLGRKSTVAVIPLVTDLPAGRQMAGFGSCNCKNFCSCCHTTIDDKNNLDYSSWKPRRWDTHMKDAVQWRDAPTLREQEKIFDAAGVRWSEFLRLPYWDPTLYVTIDSMHCFYLGLFQRHVLDIWGMNADEPDGRGRSYDLVCKPPNTQELDQAHQFLDREDYSKLLSSSVSRRVLAYLCYELDLRFSGKKATLVQYLWEYKQKQKKSHDLVHQDQSASGGSMRPASVSVVTSAPSHFSVPHFSFRNHQVAALATSSPSHASSERPISSTLTAGPSWSFGGYSSTALPLVPSDTYGSSAFVPVNLGETPGPSETVHPVSVPIFPLRTSTSLDTRVASSLSADQIDDYWSFESKSGIRRLLVEQLRDILSSKSLTPSSELKQKNKSELIATIQKLRQDASIIDSNEKPYKKRPHAHKQQADVPISQQGPTALAIADEFLVMGRIELDCEPLTHPYKPQGPVSEIQLGGKIGSSNQHARAPVHGSKPTKPKSARSTSILGKVLIQEIKKDMSRLSLPSWVARGPMYPGEARQGKLHADQWRSFCTINLVITLTRLWGTKPKESHEAKMLKNFLHLVSAVKYASLRVVDEAKIAAYQMHMHTYLQTMLNLYPGTEIAPNQHMALHFGEHLRRFGPTHAWRCFAYERFNYILQQIPTNTINSQMEKTMFSNFCIKQELRNLCRSSELPIEIHSFIPAFSRAFDGETRGTLMSENVEAEDEDVDFTETSLLPRDSYALLVDWYTANAQRSATVSRNVVLRRAVHAGVTYKVSQKSVSDSRIMFRLKADPQRGPWRAGSITMIFAHEYRGTRTTFLTIQPFDPAEWDSKQPDVFHPGDDFAFTTGYLFRKESKSPSILISVDQVIGHFAYYMTDYLNSSGDQLFQAVPLEKVRVPRSKLPLIDNPVAGMSGTLYFAIHT